MDDQEMKALDKTVLIMQLKRANWSEAQMRTIGSLINFRLTDDQLAQIDEIINQ